MFDRPFVLLDDARAQGAAPARFYRDPVEVIEGGALEAAIERLRGARTAGLHAAGFLGYDDEIWFGLFERCETIAPDDVPALLPDPAGAWARAPEPRIAYADYAAALARIRAYIEAGDIYQANFTFQADVAVAGHPLALYAGLRARARAPYGGVVFTGTRWLLSLSPELFFACRGGALTARPMKGTAPADSDPQALAADPKQRAENLMIVDLLRNDLSKVAAPGSVAVPHLFTVERYPTLHQMTSTVTARLAPNRDALDALAALFPCGSITGAPKHRARAIIAELEAEPRGVYTGAIGRLDADGDAAFNVAIRTLVLDGDGPARLGLGSGIVIDSVAGQEWRECLAKGGFVATAERFDLIETMAFDPEDGFALLDRHMARMGASAATLRFAFNHHDARNELQAATFRLRAPARVRLLLARSGAIAVEVRPPAAMPEGQVEVGLAPLPVERQDFRLRHKTSDRGFYDRARAAAGRFEVVFTDQDGFLTEGSFTNLFVPRDDTLLTPPLARGLLPGVLRAALIDQGRAQEADLRPRDLAQGFLIGNAARGLLAARIVTL